MSSPRKTKLARSTASRRLVVAELLRDGGVHGEAQTVRPRVQIRGHRPNPEPMTGPQRRDARGSQLSGVLASEDSLGVGRGCCEILAVADARSDARPRRRRPLGGRDSTIATEITRDELPRTGHRLE